MKKTIVLFVLFLSVFMSMAQSSDSFGPPSQIGKQQLKSDDQLTASVIENISIYPNPVVDVLKVSFKSDNKNTGAIYLFNIIGKQVYAQEFSVLSGYNSVSIPIRNNSIEPGIYFIQCKVGNTINTRKVIVKHDKFK